MTNFDKNVGANIAMRRKQLNLTRRELAEKSGHKESYIRSIECGVHKVGVCGLARIAYALQTNVDNLVCAGHTPYEQNEINLEIKVGAE